ncbi:DUF2269 family protein [Bacillus taeanensis]|uniref:DUF2269 domain-containing protein n=1 Tax=Bacillus taeanensis TaxID=273032 RepID=A0A366XRY6_9BACI|nr:DUF2269 family protein [Bacillus taeanensis]RBW68456.1 DUF2269 domain-containing protein [Bacillus taeanensis]
MSIYSIVLLLHIIAAVAELGAAFALPILMNAPKTVSQAKFALAVNEKVEKPVKIESITLLVTGIILGILSPYLFKKIWYIASLVIYVAIQPIVAGILPKKMARQRELLESHKGEDLPEEYTKIGKEMAPINGLAHLSAIVLIVLMTLKPF